MSGAAAAPLGPDTLRSVVRRVPHFAALSDDQVNLLLAGAALVRVAAGSVVLRPGAPPDAVRFLVTGTTDLQVAIRAVNEGAVHRFFLKPWDDEQLVATMEIQLRTHRRASSASHSS